MKATITYRDSTHKEVHTLDWLIKNAKKVHGFGFQKIGLSSGIFRAYSAEFLYETHFKEFHQLWHWLNRPVFQEKPFRVNDIKYIIGTPEYVALQKAPIPELLNKVLR